MPSFLRVQAEQMIVQSFKRLTQNPFLNQPNQKLFKETSQVTIQQQPFSSNDGIFTQIFSQPYQQQRLLSKKRSASNLNVLVAKLDASPF